MPMPTPPEQAARRHAEVAAALHRHNHLYYVLDRPEISDSAYDDLFREILALEDTFNQIKLLFILSLNH